MKNKKKQLPQDKDRHLDIPSEANRDKHINFREAEDVDQGDENRPSDEATKRRRQLWEQGIEEGKNEKKKK